MACRKNKKAICGFIVLATSQKEADNTIISIKCYYDECPFISLIYDKNLISQVNKGMKSPPSKEWNLIVFGKRRLNPSIDSKFRFFVRNDKEILFPIVRRRNNFIDADFNGMFFHKKAYKDLGSIPEMRTIEVSKIVWATHAIGKGYTFRGVAGVSIN